MARNAGAMSIAVAVERAIEIGCNFLMMVSGISLLVLLTVTAVMRYTFGTGLDFGPDLSELLFTVLVIAGIVQAARLGAHVATQLLLAKLRGSARVALAVFIHGVTATTFLALAWYGYLNALIAHDQTSPVLQIPRSVGYGCLAVGLAFVALCSLTAIVRLLIEGSEVNANATNPANAESGIM